MSAEGRSEVVGGNSYIEPAGIYSKAFALVWFFPLRAAGGELDEHCGFMASNVAFRTRTLARFPFPAIEGTSRGACDLPADTLRSEGIPTGSPRSRSRRPATRSAWPASS